jgi:hypothetical protein
MKIEYVGHWDRFYITPSVAIVLDPLYNGYKYLSISWFKHSIELSWGHVKGANDE